MSWYAEIERLNDFPRWHITLHEDVTFIIPGTTEPYTTTFEGESSAAYTRHGAQRRAKRMVARRNRATDHKPEVVR